MAEFFHEEIFVYRPCKKTHSFLIFQVASLLIHVTLSVTGP